MKILEPKLDLVGIFKKISEAQQRVLLLDYDGTLAPFCTERDRAVPYAGVRGLLAALAKDCRTRLVIISGRPVKALVPLLGLEKLPEIWGCHGYEQLMPDGTLEVPDLDECALQGLVEAEDWLRAIGLADRCEQKSIGLALHWRGLEREAIKDIRKRVRSNLVMLAKQTGLRMDEFDGGIELRIPNINKGSVVEIILAQAGLDALVVYMGDDKTDEDAFKAIKGRGIGILVRQRLRSTAADLWLKPPEELLDFLCNWATLTAFNPKSLPAEIKSLLVFE